jgi:hypothetical protein
MAPKKTLLEQMSANPKKGWQIKDIEKLCNQTGLEMIAPTSGSHFKICSSYLRDILTVPAKRPIKAIYIKKLVSYAEAHAALGEAKDD